MKVYRWKKWNAALMLAALLPLAVRGQDEKSERREQGKRVRVVVNMAGKNWLGVHAVPVDDSLKAQLGIKDRLIVHHVIPDSPAAKAGLQVHDIVIRLGDREIANLADLMKTVADLGEKEARLVVLRGGKETALTVKPGERPADETLHVLVPQIDDEGLKYTFTPWSTGDQFIWRGIGPGVLKGPRGLFDANFEFPDGLSIAISKEKDQPAKITIKRDGQTYETTMDRLSELPKDVGVIVGKMFAGPKGAMWLGSEANVIVKEKLLKEKDKALKEQRSATEELKKADGDVGRSRREVLRADEGVLQELRKSIDALRQEVQQLKESSKSDRKGV